MSGESSPDERIVDRTNESPRLPSLSRYDWAMLNIPLCYFAALLLSTTLSIPVFPTMSVASVLGLAVIADVLFWHPPTSSTEGTTD